MAVTEKLNDLLRVTVVLAELVMTGAWSTVRVKFCCADPAAIVAVMVRASLPPVPAAGVPDSSAEVTEAAR